MTPWPAAPEPVPPLSEDVHVWAVALDARGSDADPASALLSAAEQQRAKRFKFTRDRRRYLVAHTALRDILSRYLNVAGAVLDFSEGENGKPRLERPPGATDLEFNLSHSHERALIAVSRGRVVGVDLEFVKDGFDFHQVAEHFFTPREVAEIEVLPPALQCRAFYKCWTSKEAFLKAKGVGLSGALDEVRIGHSPGNQIEIGAAVPGWSLIEINPGDGYQAALVVQGNTRPIQCFWWQ